MSKREIQALARIVEILNSRNSSTVQKIDSSLELSLQPRDIRLAIVDELSSELTERGLDEKDEHNPYGEEIEHLIDSCRLHYDQ